MLFAAVLATALFVPSCSNDIDLTAEWKDIPIVYGLLSASDSVNYIRVEKAFLDNSTSALDLARNPDSLYYDNISVQVRNLSASTSVVYDLEKINGEDEGLVREEGIFSESPNILYKLVLPNGELLQGGDDYQLEINRGDNKELVTATTTIVEDVIIREPSTDPSNSTPLNWARGGLRVAWRAVDDAKIFDVLLTIKIEETDVTNPANDKVVTLFWKIEENTPAEISNNLVRMESRLSGLDLYTFLSNRLEENPNVSRKFASLDILVTGGGETLSSYIEAGNANTGITSTQVIPTFTNLSEGFGIFSSRNYDLHEGYTINAETLDSLQNSPLTRDFNFN